MTIFILVAYSRIHIGYEYSRHGPKHNRNTCICNLNHCCSATFDSMQVMHLQHSHFNLLYGDDDDDTLVSCVVRLRFLPDSSYIQTVKV